MSNFNYGDEKEETTPKPTKIDISPKNVVSSNEEKIENIISTGGSVVLNMNTAEYNRLYDLFKPQRKAGKIRMTYDGISKAEVTSDL